MPSVCQDPACRGMDLGGDAGIEPSPVVCKLAADRHLEYPKFDYSFPESKRSLR
jgi:hypothetical protein